MELSKLTNRLNQLQVSIKELLFEVGDELDNVRYDREDIDESFLRDEYYMLVDKLESIDIKLSYLQRNIREIGLVTLQSNGRYQLPSGFEFTSGSHCEILVVDRYGDEMWRYTSIEHNGSFYYATALGRDKRIDGYVARIRY